MLGYIDSFLSNPKEMLIFFLLAFPGRILALSAHEWGHAMMADRLGDPTARMLGRLTLNPFRHLDPVGTVMMLLFGFGWAKPVPVNPRNYRHFRRDDLLVSIAGVAMNLGMFIIGVIALYGILITAINRIPTGYGGAIFRGEMEGEMRLFILKGDTYYYWPMKDLLVSAAYAGDDVIAAVFGSTVGFLYDMLGYFVITNIVLFVFNLLPVPPLDGYHVLNDLFIHRTSLFARPKTARICTGVLMLLCLSGLLGKGLSFIVNDGVFAGIAKLAGRLFHLY